MEYYFSKYSDKQFETIVLMVKEQLKKEGFGIVSEIDIKEKIKEKLEIDYPKYLILGVCNPKFAYQALLAEPHVGSMLPCNVVIRECEKQKIEVFAVDPIASMQAIDNKKLLEVAKTIQSKLENVIQSLNL